MMTNFFPNELSILFLLSLGLCLNTDLIGQQLEVDGKVKIKEMDTIASEANVVVRQADGVLAEKDLNIWIIKFLVNLPNGIQNLLDAGVAPLHILNEGASTNEFIGLNYAGGIIFYMQSDGTGLVAATSDQSIAAPWGCYGHNIPGAAGTAIGTGSQNTIDIENACSTNGIAADLCTNLVRNGYDDWFLPSKDELNEMYEKIGYGASPPNTNIGSFAPVIYWSSSEFDQFSAWDQSIGNGNLGGGNKAGTLYVRAIRAL